MAILKMTQQEYLRGVKAFLDVEWAQLAERAGIKPRRLKTYLMPPLTSEDYRPMPDLVKQAIDALLASSSEKKAIELRTCRLSESARKPPVRRVKAVG